MDFESGLIYNVFIIIACGLAYWTERPGYRPLGLLLTFAFVVIFWAIRYDIGNDYKGYMTIFYLVKYGYPYEVELGYRWLNKCFAWSQTGYIGALGVMTILSYFFLFKMFIREKILTLGLFFSMAFLLQFMLTNQVRQAFVLVYFLSVVHYLEEGKYWKYILSLLPMLLFHLSVVLLFPLVFVVKLRLSKITWAIALIGTYIMYLLGFFKEIGTKLMMAFPLYDQYKLTERMMAEDVGFSSVMLFGLCVALFILFFSDSINRPVLLTIYLLGILFYNVFIEFHLIGRVIFYLTYLNVILASVLVKKDWHNGAVLLGVTWLMFLLLAGKEPAYHGNLPYQTIFDVPLNRY